MHLHILGICGTFMGGLAKIARERGHVVTGCDAQVYPPMSDQLRALGIRLHEGYDAEQLDRYKADLLVVGNAMVRGMPVVEEMLNRGPALRLRARSGSARTCCGDVGDRRWRARTASPRPPRWSRGSSPMRALTPGFLIGGIARNFHMSARWRPTRRSS